MAVFLIVLEISINWIIKYLFPCACFCYKLCFKNLLLFLLIAEYLLQSLAWSAEVSARNLWFGRTPWKKTSVAPLIITPGFSNCLRPLPTPGKETMVVTMVDYKPNTARDSTILIFVQVLKTRHPGVPKTKSMSRPTQLYVNSLSKHQNTMLLNSCSQCGWTLIIMDGKSPCQIGKWRDFSALHTMWDVPAK